MCDPVKTFEDVVKLVAGKDRQIKDLKAEIAQLQAENVALCDRLRDETDMNSAEHIVQDRLQAEVERLEGRISEREVYNKRLEACNGRLEADNERLDADNARFKRRIFGLEACNKRLNTCNKRLNTRNKRLKAYNERLSHYPSIIAEMKKGSCTAARVCEDIEANVKRAIEREQDTGAAKPTNGLVYLATPYTHKDPSVMQHRVNVVNRVAARLMREGANIFSPISHSHSICMASDLSGDWDFWKVFDRVILEKCVKMIVLKQDGWQQSRGVTAEINMADEIGLPVEYMDTPTAVRVGEEMTDSCSSIEPDEVGVLIRRAYPQARVVHVCCECHGAIIPGDLYERHVLRYDNKLSVFKTCLTCSRIRKRLFTYGGHYGGMWADIHKAYCDTDYCICSDLFTYSTEEG